MPQLRVRRMVAAMLFLAMPVSACSSSHKAAPSPSETPSTPASASVAPSAEASGSEGQAETGSAVVPVGSGRRLAPTVMGLHENGIGGGAVPRTSFGAVRLWDSGVTWRDLQPAPGRWNFAPLDRAVATASAAHARPLLVLGQTPAFAATTNSTGVYGLGANAMPKMALWQAYVRAVATRYRGRIHEYEIWNEPNVVMFWSGTPQQLVSLATAARAIIKKLDPTALVTTPGMVVRRPPQRGWLSRYLSAGGGAAADVVSIHLYPDATSAPEDVAGELADVRARLAAAKVTLPIWDTEINYGLPTGGAAAGSALAPDVQAGYVARTFLVAASRGVDRTYWYSWDNQAVGVRALTPAGQLTVAGAAFTTVYRWLVGHEFRGCSADTSGTWSCSVDRDRIVWNTRGSATLAAPPGSSAVVALDGRSTPVKAGAVLQLSQAPVKVEGTG